MKEIIEKLGMTPGPLNAIELTTGKYIITKGTISLLSTTLELGPYGESLEPWGVIDKKEDALLYAAAPEMLLAIIGMVDCAETNSMYKAAKILELMKEVAEKACYPKKWEEIKELLK